MTGIDQCISAAGSQTAVAEVLDITPQAVQGFVQKGYFPIDRAIQAQRIWGVAFADLVRPDIAEAIRTSK